MTEYTQTTERLSQVFNKLDTMVAPAGSILNEGSTFKIYEVGNFSDLIRVIDQAKDEALPPILIFLNIEFLSVVVKYQDLIPCNLGVFSGMTKGDYNGLFESAVFALERVSYQAAEDLLAGKPEVSRNANILKDREDKKAVSQLSNSNQDQITSHRQSSDFGPSATEEEEDYSTD